MVANLLVRRLVVLVTAGVLGALAACSSAPPASSPVPDTTVPAPTTTPPAVPTTTAPTSTVPTSTAPGTLPRCTTAELSGSLGPGDAAAGSVYRPLLLKNIGTQKCELRGFPGVSYVAGDDGHQVGPAAAMSGDRGPDIPIAVGGSAQAQVQFAGVQNFDAAVCMPTPVRGLRIYPPGDTASLFVPMDGAMGCAGTPPANQLSVQTMTPA